MALTSRFATLDDVPLAEAWAHEARDFTPWLAENLDRLSNAIGMPLELTDTEVAVENFSADIIARNSENDSVVLIENQFKSSDHGHLGQILTYLAGLNATTIIWIAPDFREAHLSAVRWLNDHTEDPFAFFAIKLSVVRIHDSPMVPVFKVIERPNNWDRQFQHSARSKVPSGLSELRRELWAHILQRHPSEGDPTKSWAASSRWRELPEYGLVVAQYLAQSGPGIFIRCPRGGDYEAAADLLQPCEQELERRLQAPFYNPRYLFIKHLRLDVNDKGNWDRIADWLHAEADRYVSTLRKVLGSSP
jgi:hypothetical protein